MPLPTLNRVKMGFTYMKIKIIEKFKLKIKLTKKGRSSFEKSAGQHSLRKLQEVGAILVICISNLEFAEIKEGKKTSYCLNVSLIFPIIWRVINISVVII